MDEMKLIQSALHVSGDVSAHHQEHVTVFTVSGSVHPSCCRLVSLTSWNCFNSSMTPAGSNLSEYYQIMKIQSSAPDDGRKHRPKHVELTRNNKLTCIVASCWLLSYFDTLLAKASIWRDIARDHKLLFLWNLLYFFKTYYIWTIHKIFLNKFAIRKRFLKILLWRFLLLLWWSHQLHISLWPNIPLSKTDS